MKTFHSKKWNIDSQMGFIEVDIKFFIGLEIISQTLHEVQSDFSLVHVHSNLGKLIIEKSDWEEIQSILRTIKIDHIIKNKNSL